MFKEGKSRAELRSHGNLHLEVKTRYPLRSAARTRYEMDLFIITPHQLGLEKGRFGKEEFYRDIKSNTRYTINEINLSDLVSADNEVSPVARITEILDRQEPPSEKENKELLFELRSISNYYSTQLKYTYRTWKRKFYNKTDSFEYLEEHIHEITSFLKVVRDLLPGFIRQDVSPEIRQAALWMDESISLTTERILMHYYLRLKKDDRYDSLCSRIYTITAAEKKYRESREYPSADIDRGVLQGERGIERESLLKKWSQSVLYLTNQDSRIDKGLVHLFAGTAAAVAMSLAVLMAFFADTWFSSYTVPWALVIVVSYILKDRIKEIVRGLLIRVLPRLIADRTEKLIDQRKKETVGRSRSLVKFIREGSLPEEIREAMDQGRDELTRTQPEGNVILFKKTILLKSRKLLREHSRVNSITEIIRISIDPFLEQMDNSQKSICRADDDGSLTRIGGNRIYHCDIFVQLVDNAEKQVRVFWYDAVLTQKGLLRIDKKNF